MGRRTDLLLVVAQQAGLPLAGRERRPVRVFQGQGDARRDPQRQCAPQDGHRALAVRQPGVSPGAVV